MTEHDLFNYFNKEVKVTCVDGQIISGYVIAFTSKIDSEDGIPSILVESNESSIELYLNEIKLINIRKRFKHYG